MKFYCTATALAAACAFATPALGADANSLAGIHWWGYYDYNVIDPEPAQVDAAARIGARVCEIHTGPYAHAFHAKGRDPRSAAVVAELHKIRDAGAAVRALGMRFNAGHALNYVNVQPVAALPGVRELHIGHAIVSRAVFVGLREAVRQMKALIREAAVQNG